MGRSRSNSPATNYRGTYRVSKAKKAKRGKRRRRRKKGGNEGDDEGYGGEGGNHVHNYDIEVSVTPTSYTGLGSILDTVSKDTEDTALFSMLSVS